MSLPAVFDLHGGSTISTISMVDDMLDPAIRKSHSVLSPHVYTLITSPLLTKVCVVLAIMHSILKVEITTSTMIPCPSTPSGAGRLRTLTDSRQIERV